MLCEGVEGVCEEGCVRLRGKILLCHCGAFYVFGFAGIFVRPVFDFESSTLFVPLVLSFFGFIYVSLLPSPPELASHIFASPPVA